MPPISLANVLAPSTPLSNIELNIGARNDAMDVAISCTLLNAPNTLSLNVSLLAIATPNATPRATNPPTIRPIGLNRNPTTVVSVPNPLTKPPSILIAGPIPTKKPVPIAVAFRIRLCVDESKPSNLDLISATLSTNALKLLPNATPKSAAFFSTTSNLVLKSISKGFSVEKKPPPCPPASRKLAPIREIDAPMLEIPATSDFSPIILAAPPILFSIAERNILVEISPLDAILNIASSDTLASLANH